MAIAKQIEADKPAVIVLTGLYENNCYKLGCALAKLGLRSEDGVHIADIAHRLAY